MVVLLDAERMMREREAARQAGMKKLISMEWFLLTENFESVIQKKKK